MKISVFYDHIVEAVKQTGLPVSNVLNKCKNMGIEGVEISYSLLKENYDTIVNDLMEASISISCIYEFYDFGKNTDINQAKEHIDTASKLGVEQILIIPGFLQEKEALELNRLSGSKEDTMKYMNEHVEIKNMKDALIKLSEYALKNNITITLEDFDGATAPFARIYQLLWFMEQVPNLKYTLDTGNFVFSDEDILKAYDVLKDYIVHVHCKDRGIEEDKLEGKYFKGMGVVHTGSGYLPMAELIKKLKKDNYNGYLAIEHFDAPNQLEFMKKSAEFINKLL